MKKVILILGMISLLLLTGCNTKYDGRVKLGDVNFTTNSDVGIGTTSFGNSNASMRLIISPTICEDVKKLDKFHETHIILGCVLKEMRNRNKNLTEQILSDYSITVEWDGFEIKNKSSDNQ